MAHTATPSLNTDNGIALVDDAELETVVNGPLQTTVNILLPDLDIEVRLLLAEVERPDTAVQVRVLESTVVSVERTRSSTIRELTREAVALRVTMRTGQTGRYLDRRRAVLPLHI